MTIKLRDEATKQIPCLPVTAGKRQAGSSRGSSLRKAPFAKHTQGRQGRRNDNKTKKEATA